MTFTGQQQELHFAKTNHLLHKFADQIVHVSLHHLQGEDAWQKEAFHRRHVFTTGLHQTGKEIQPDDIVILSDLDEIPRPEVLLALKTCSGWPVNLTLECPLAYYSYGLEGPAWSNIKVSVWSDGMDAEDIRARTGDHKMTKGCWHCSYCFPHIADVINKIESFSHVEYNQLPYIDPAHIVANTRDGLDLFDRESDFAQVMTIDAPSYVWTKPELSYLLNRSSISAGYKDYHNYFMA